MEGGKTESSECAWVPPVGCLDGMGHALVWTGVEEEGKYVRKPTEEATW